MRISRTGEGIELITMNTKPAIWGGRKCLTCHSLFLVIFLKERNLKFVKNNIVLVLKILSKGEFTGTSIVQAKKLILVEILLLSFLF